MNKIVLFFSLLIILLSGNAFAGKNDTLQYPLDYWFKKCEPHQAHYIRVAFKEGDWWHVQDIYAQTGTLYKDGLYSDDSMTVGGGMIFFYHPNGKLEKKARHIKGKLEGLVKVYDTAGHLVDSGIYSKGIPKKAHYKWNNEGKLVFKGEYDEEGYGVGQEWEYFEDGKTAAWGITGVEGKRDSIWTYYNHAGGITALDMYDKGSRIGRICYDEKGEQYNGTCEDTPPQPIEKSKDLGRKINAAFRDYIEFNAIDPRTLTFKKGTVMIVLITVKEDGSVERINIAHGIDPKFDRYFATELKDAKFIPAKAGNRNVKQTQEFPIPFG